jgi:hypothetical protein
MRYLIYVCGGFHFAYFLFLAAYTPVIYLNSIFFFDDVTVVNGTTGFSREDVPFYRNLKPSGDINDQMERFGFNWWVLAIQNLRLVYVALAFFGITTTALFKANTVSLFIQLPAILFLLMEIFYFLVWWDQAGLDYGGFNNQDKGCIVEQICSPYAYRNPPAFTNADVEKLDMANNEFWWMLVAIIVSMVVFIVACLGSIRVAKESLIAEAKKSRARPNIEIIGVVLSTLHTLAIMAFAVYVSATYLNLTFFFSEEDMDPSGNETSRGGVGVGNLDMYRNVSVSDGEVLQSMCRFSTTWWWIALEVVRPAYSVVIMLIIAWGSLPSRQLGGEGTLGVFLSFALMIGELVKLIWLSVIGGAFDGHQACIESHLCSANSWREGSATETQSSLEFDLIFISSVIYFGLAGLTLMLFWAIWPNTKPGEKGDSTNKGGLYAELETVGGTPQQQPPTRVNATFPNNSAQPNNPQQQLVLVPQSPSSSSSPALSSTMIMTSLESNKKKPAPPKKFPLKTAAPRRPHLPRTVKINKKTD